MHLLKRFRRRRGSNKPPTTDGDFPAQQNSLAQAPQSISARPRPDVEQLNFFTIRGFMRSGTNWANNLLNLHPHVASFGEVHLNSTRLAMDQWLAEDWSVPNRMNVSDLVVKHFEKFAKETLLECVLASRPINQKAFTCIGDRSPRALDEIIINESKQIRMIRDGRDVLVSWTFLNFAKNQLNVFDDNPEMMIKYQTFHEDPNYFNKHPEQLLDNEQWVHKVARMWGTRVKRDDAFIQDTYSGESSNQVLSVRYEDLHRDTEKMRNKMYQFLELDPVLAAPLDTGRYKTSAGMKKEDPTNLYRRGVVGDWKKYFCRTTEDWFESAARDCLATHDYLNTRLNSDSHK